MRQINEALQRHCNKYWSRERIKKNFQLIVITHDEEFMDYLASQQELGGGLPEAYFRIQRETDGNSMHYHSVARRVTFK